MVTRLEAQGKSIFQWGDKFVDITELERVVYQTVLSLGRDIMSRCIEQAGSILAERQGIQNHNSQDSHGRDNIPPSCLPRGGGFSSLHEHLPAGQEYGS